MPQKNICFHLQGQRIRQEATSIYCLLHVCFLLGLVFDHEEGIETIFGTVAGVQNYTSTESHTL
jgi:hypothetical protein